MVYPTSEITNPLLSTITGFEPKNPSPSGSENPASTTSKQKSPSLSESIRLGNPS